MNFHEKIKLLRNELGLTQKQASKKMTIGITSLKNYEKDKLPDSQQLKKIKEFYNVPYEYLLNDECNTKETNNLIIGENLGISDKSITILKKLSLNENREILEHLLDYIYTENSLEKIKEYISVNYIIDTTLNNVFPKIEKLFKENKYENITNEQLDSLNFFIKYNNSVKNDTIIERNYLKYLLSDIDYDYYIDNLKTILLDIENKSTINDVELKSFIDYKKIKKRFISYKSYLLTDIYTKIDNDFVKQFNLNFKK